MAGIITGTPYCSFTAMPVGTAWSFATQPQAASYPSGARMQRFLGGRCGQQQQKRSGIQEARSRRPLREFGFGQQYLGPARPGLVNNLWLLGRATSGEKVTYGEDDGGGDGNYGGHSGGGGGGGYGGSGDGLGDGHTGDLAPVAALWLWYNGTLESHPLISKSLTAGLLNCFADIFCQVFVEKEDRIDWQRLASFVAVGLFLSGPGLHYWYGALPKVVTIPGLGGVLLRIGLDQVIFTPLGMIGFFVTLLALEGRPGEIRGKLDRDLLPTIVANWKVWIPFQIVNFGFVPPQLQVAAAGLLGMVWSVFISYKGHT